LITNQLLKECLVSIFFNNNSEFEKYVVPIKDDWYLPVESIDNLKETWIGYSVMSHRALQPATKHGSILLRSVKTSFRITFVGQQAEEIANSTFLWEYKEDVNKIFLEKMFAQLNHDEQSHYSKIIKNDDQCGLIMWFVDMSANSFYIVDTHETPWININGNIKLTDNQKIVDLFPLDGKAKNYKEMTLEETIKCKDRVPGKGLNDCFCRNVNCNCSYKSCEEVHLYIDSQELSQGRNAKYTGATKL